MPVDIPATSRANASETLASLPGPAAPTYWRALGPGIVLVLGHLAVVAALYVALYGLGIVQALPGEKNLSQWDTGWYQSIRDGGYVYREDAQSNVAFFPFFPYCWRFLGLSYVGISLANTLVGAGGVAVLATALPCTRRQRLLLASVPLLFFTWVPYSEAWFYFFSGLLLVGLHRQHRGWLVVGLLGCCLTRAAATFFLPALLFTTLVSWLQNRATPTAARTLLLGGLAMALGMGAVAGLQHAQTGEWLGFYKAQRYWNHAWHSPDWPLHGSAGVRMLWLDALSIGTALGAGLTGGYLLASRGWRCYQGRASRPVSGAVLFSLVYCAGMGVFIVFEQGGDLTNASRYILGTPFFAVLLWAGWQRPSAWWGWLLGGVVFGLLAALLGFPARFAGFGPGQAAWYFGLAAGYALLLAVAGRASARLPFQRELAGTAYLLNVLLQVLLLNWYLQSVWLG